FYSNAGFCDYPPGYLYILWVTAHMLDWLGIHTTTGIELAYKMAPILFDMGAAALLYGMARKHHAKGALALAMVYAFNPAVIMNGAAWGQVDSALALLLAAVVALAVKGRWLWALPLFGLAALVKPQALMMGPLGLCAFILDWVKNREKGRRYHTRMVVAIGLCLAAIMLVSLPFNGGRVWSVWLIELYGETLSSYAEPTVNTANLSYLLGQNWGDLEAVAPLWVSLTLAGLCLEMAVWSHVKSNKKLPFAWSESAVYLAGALALIVLVLIGCTYSLMGTVLMALAFLIVIQQFLRAGKAELLPLMGANLLLLLYAFGVKMHERYLFPALLLWALAYVFKRDRRILWLMAGSTVTLFVNTGIILDKSIRLSAEQAHLNVGAPGWEGVLGVINLALALYSIYVGRQIALAAKPWQIPETKANQTPVDGVMNSLLRKTDHRLHMRAKDYLIMGLVTLVYSVVALWNLGSTVAPQTTWKSTSTQEQVIFDLGKDTDFKTLYYCQVSRSNFSIAVSEDGETWSREYPAEMAEGLCYRWMYLMQSDGDVAAASFSSNPLVLSGRYVRITSQQIGLKLNEMIFRDVSGNQLMPAVVASLGGNDAFGPVSDPSLIVDEQDTLSGEPSWYNGTYFDEIYHARTAYEHAHAWDEDAVFPYETSHPPLGKVIMSWFVMLFGMTPFGWRFAGALMGILMLPAMYLLGKQLFKRTELASAAMLLMAFDLMHLTQTRIATIDSFPVLFIIVAFFFMLRFMQVDPWTNPLSTSLWPLLGSGICMGLAIASKWIGVYAGIGLAALYFWTCLRHLSEHYRAKRLNMRDVSSDRQRAVEIAANDGFKIVTCQCLWCLLFFIVIPLLIYYCAYIPYFAPDGGVTVEKVIEAAIGRANANGVRSGGMLGYHSTPGLGMDHPYYSPWWEWPLIMKPMWYASSNANLVPEGMDYTIFCMGNPAVWWLGLAGLIYVILTFCKRHLYLTEPIQGRIRLHPQEQEHTYAFLLIAFAAQFLPWVLVPRGTYIYHYFASVPFIICCSVMMWRNLPGNWGKGLLWAHVVLSGCMFILFYPYASGEMVSVNWLEAPKMLMNWARSQEGLPRAIYHLLTWFPKIYY
ncbi:MAG: glycosyltransferase family 39 protein, partial [Clostridia bacterium]|nr:glycosyltransferase family 39 protein [Clostridia bacterium]